jgi:hypothetical protein
MHQPRHAITVLLTLFLLTVVAGSAIAQETSAGEVIAAPTTLRYSIHLPGDWQFRSKQGDSVLTDYLAFGDSAALVERTLLTLGGETPEGVATGVGGWAAMLNQAFWRINAPTPSEQISAFLQASMVASEVVGQQTITLGGLYPGAVVLAIDRTSDTEGYVGAVQVGEQDVLVFIVGVGPSREFAANDALIQAIIQSIRAPAEAGAQTSIVVVPAFTPSGQTAPTAQPLATTPAGESDSSNLVFYAMDGGVASMTLPENWIVYDFLANENVFAYGDSDEAALSRLATARPDMVSEAPALTGLGGLIILYDPAEAGIDPAAPDLAPVLDSVTSRLSGQGYTILKPGTDFTVGGHAGRYALVRGTEYGYVALVLYDDKLAFVTATGMPEDFESDAALFDRILASLRVPADPPPADVQVTPSGGIGGLGGSTDATPEVTPTSMPGIGGLGG